MLPKNEASRAQQYLMYCPSNGWQCCCFSYIITKILWFSCILTKGTGDLHLLHLIPKEPSRQKQGRERPHCVQRAPWRGSLQLGHEEKAKKRWNTTWKTEKKSNFSTPISNTSRRWETPVQPSGFVLSWIKYPHLTGENDLECFMDYSGKFSTSLCFSTWRSSTSTLPETLRQFKYQRLKQSIGSEETAAIPRRRRDQTSLIFPHKWNSTILVPPFWTSRFHLWIKPSWEHKSHLQPWSMSFTHPSHGTSTFLKGENTARKAGLRHYSMAVIPRKSAVFLIFP